MLDSKEFVTSEIIVGRLSQRLIIATALPIFDASGKLEMVIALGADLQQLNAIGTEAHTKFGGGLAVLNSHGSASAVLPEAENSNPSHAFSEPSVIHAILAANAPTIEAVARTGTSRIYGIEQLPQGQRIAVALNRDEVLMPVERSFRSDLLFLLLVAAGSIAAALIVAEFGVLRGVRLLKGAALRLKAGKMGVRVKLPPLVAAELDDLAVTYNAMTAEFERLAYLDRLTGLPNRRYLERQLNDQKLLAGDTRHAVFAIDLDGFKPVNDTYGHAVGDRVLTAVGRRIAMVIDERGLLARVGGDEFVAIIPLPQIEHREFARSLAEEILVAMDAPLDLDGFPFPVGCSVGIAMVPDDAATLGGALIRADAALYKAKRSGRNRVIDNAPPLAAEMIAEDSGKQPHWTPIESPEAN
jgi:diguanylate cyclase (GGDEF)-like protein